MSSVTVPQPTAGRIWNSPGAVRAAYETTLISTLTHDHVETKGWYPLERALGDRDFTQDCVVHDRLCA